MNFTPAGLLDWVPAFTLALARIGAAMVLLPGVGEAVAPASVRIGLALSLTILVVPELQPMVPPVPEASVTMGLMIAGANNRGVCLFEFTDRGRLEAQFRTLKKLFKCAAVPGENAHLALLRKELEQYFAGKLRQFSVPLLFPSYRRFWQDQMLKRR